MASLSARCSDCKTCHQASGRGAAHDVVWCPQVSQYRSSVIFRDCDFFKAMDKADYSERYHVERLRREVLVGAAVILHERKYSAADFRAVN